eukprot:6172291-Amphidinium_carterae.1
MQQRQIGRRLGSSGRGSLAMVELQSSLTLLVQVPSCQSGAFVPRVAEDRNQSVQTLCRVYLWVISSLHACPNKLIAKATATLIHHRIDPLLWTVLVLPSHMCGQGRHGSLSAQHSCPVASTRAWLAVSLSYCSNVCL